MAKVKTITETIATREVKMTNDYAQFRYLTGNRELNHQHVNQLIRLLTENGNLTDQFPIVISKDGYVIDGQHRLEALKTLGWEVGYIVEENANIETVRRINQGNRNWGWRDIAESYANLGNKEYAWFLDFFEKHEGITYTLAMLFCGARLAKRYSNNTSFNKGDLRVEDKVQAELFANQYEELVSLTDVTSHDFGKALNRVFRSPFYDHERMVRKVSELGNQLPAKANNTDYQRELERIYNYGFSEENKARLF